MLLIQIYKLKMGLSSSEPKINSISQKLRVIGYIDGFNTFYGIKETNRRENYWYNPIEIVKRVATLAGSEIEIVEVNFFTAMLNHDSRRLPRQQNYINALTATPLIHIRYGRFNADPSYCRCCKQEHPKMQEKNSDVNLATALVFDALHDRYDVAVLISGDSDFVGPVERILEKFPNKVIIAGFSQNRRSDALHIATKKRSAQLHDWVLAKCHLPEVVISKSGKNQYTRPDEWTKEAGDVLEAIKNKKVADMLNSKFGNPDKRGH